MKLLALLAVVVGLAGCASQNSPPLVSAPYTDTFGGLGLMANSCKAGTTWYCEQLTEFCQGGSVPACNAVQFALGTREQSPAQSPAPGVVTAPRVNGRSEIALHGEGGTFTVPVSINGAMTLKFTIDSGATDVSIPIDVVMTLMRTGTIDRSDFLGSRTYALADGSTAPSPIFRIRSLRVGDREVQNVPASIVSAKGGLLLGQSFLSQLGSVSIDYRRGVLVLE